MIPVGGPEEISQREAVRLFEEAYGKKFSVIEIPEVALEAQWSTAQNPFDRTFAGLMLAVARGLGSGTEPPFEQFPMQMTSPREYVRGVARASGETTRAASRESSPMDGSSDTLAELR